MPAPEHDPDTWRRWVLSARQLLAAMPQESQARDQIVSQTGLLPDGVDRLVAEANRQQEAEWSDRKPRARLQAIERLRTDLVKMRGLESPPRHSIARTEELLMRLEGTAAPVEIHATHSMVEDLTRTLGGIGPDDLHRLAAETAERLGEEAPPRGGAGRAA